MPAPLSSRSSAKPSCDQPVRILRIPAPRCRNPAQQGLRCDSSEGAERVTTVVCDMSFEILNLWISKRGFEISLNRIEAKNSCRLNLWRQEFVLLSAVAAGGGHSPQCGSCCGQARCARARCMVKVNSVPSPRLLVTVMVSPMRVSSSFAIERPKPLPLPLCALSTL